MSAYSKMSNPAVSASLPSVKWMSAQEYQKLPWHLQISDDNLPLEDPPIDMDEAAIVKYLKDIGLCRRGIDNHSFLPDSEKLNWGEDGERGYFCNNLKSDNAVAMIEGVQRAPNAVKKHLAAETRALQEQIIERRLQERSRAAADKSSAHQSAGLNSVDLRYAWLVRVDFHGLHVPFYKAAGAVLVLANFTDAVLLNADFDTATCGHACFDRASMRYSCFNHCHFVGCSFRGAFLAMNECVGANFYMADMRDATITASNLSESSLNKIRVRPLRPPAQRDLGMQVAWRSHAVASASLPALMAQLGVDNDNEDDEGDDDDDDDDDGSDGNAAEEDEAAQQTPVGRAMAAVGSRMSVLASAAAKIIVECESLRAEVLERISGLETALQQGEAVVAMAQRFDGRRGAARHVHAYV